MALEKSFLKAIPYFAELNEEDLELVRGTFSEKEVNQGQIIEFEGEFPKAMYLVGSGLVKIFRTSSDGKEQILNIARPGDLFNDVPMFDDGKNLASFQTMGPVKIYILSKNTFRAFLSDHPKVMISIAKKLAGDVRHLVSLVTDLSFRPVIGRVAKVLIEYGEDRERFGHRLTQQEMATIVGTAREMVSRSLKALEAGGVIKVDRHRIIITDKEALRSIAGLDV